MATASWIYCSAIRWRMARAMAPFRTAAVLPVLATGFNQTYAVDVNGDGKLDIMRYQHPARRHGQLQPFSSRSRYSAMMAAEHSHLWATSPSAPPFQTVLCCSVYNIFGLSFADVNGDGKLDVLSQSNSVPMSIARLQDSVQRDAQHGDGTFGAAKPLDTSALQYPRGCGSCIWRSEWRWKAGPGSGLQTLGPANRLSGSRIRQWRWNFRFIRSTAAHQLSNPPSLTRRFRSSTSMRTENSMRFWVRVKLALGKGDGTFSLATPLFPQPASPQTPLNYSLLQANLFPAFMAVVCLSQSRERSECGIHAAGQQRRNSECGSERGTHTLTAQYSGDSTYAAGVSPSSDDHGGSGRDHDGGHLVGESQLCGSECHFHRNDCRTDTGRRRNSDILQWIDHAGHGAGQQWERQLHHKLFQRGQPDDYGGLWRRRQ